MGSIQYAGSHLHTPLFVVLGHEGCGAVKAAMESKLKGAKHRSRIQILVNNIIPGLSKRGLHLSSQDQLAWAVEANVRWSMHQLMETPEAKQAASEGQKKLVGAVFEINSGRRPDKRDNRRVDFGTGEPDRFRDASGTTTIG